jgi:serine/threonine protein kinase
MSGSRPTWRARNLLNSLDLRKLPGMKLLTQPGIKPSRHNEEARTAKEWLDALVSGACDLPAFLSGAGDLLHKAPDAGWDLLSLVDQYYRRGKISAELFGAVKAHLQGILVGKGTAGGGNMPLPMVQDDPPRPASATVAMPLRDPVSEPVSAPVPNAISVPVSVPAHIGRSTPISVPVSVPHIARSVPVSVPVDAAPEAPLLTDTTRSPAPRALAVGDVLRGRYRVQGLLGRGGMGTVFAAADQYRLDRSGGDQRIAIKVLHTEVIKRPRLFAELRREFQHLQSLSHPNIVRVHEFDRDGDLAFFTMEYLSGALLSRVLSIADSGALHRPYALAIVRDVGAAIAHAHARGVVHGDLNPANIFITDDGEVRVLDFGASHQLHHGPWISEFDDQRPIAVATPSYASCQVLEGEVADARDDVYALACVAYALLSGKHPFNDDTALVARTSRATPKRPNGLTARQWNALREGLRFDRERRPSDIRSWLGRLDLRAAVPRLPALQYLMEARHQRGSAMKWRVAAALIAFVVAGAWLFGGRDFALARTATSLSAWVTSLFPHDARMRSKLTIPPADDSDALGSRPEPEPAPAKPAPAAAGPSERSSAHPDATVDPRTLAQPSLPSSSSNSRAPLTAPSSAHPLPGAVAPRASAAASAAPAGSVARSGAAPVQVGNAPRAQIELAVDNVEVAAGEAMARITVRRSRTFRDEVSFKWWTESGTAKPGQDFVPVKTQVEYIENGKNSANLVVPLVMDPARRTARNFYVVIDEASDNATLGSRTLTMVTIPGTE